MPRPSAIVTLSILGFTASTTTLHFTSPSLAATKTPINVPAQPDQLLQTVQTLHDQMDNAANQRDRQGLLKFYSLEFTNSDGINRVTLGQSLRQLWQQYPQLNYRTKVLNVTPKDDGIDAETQTQVTGQQIRGGRTVQVNINVKSRQRWENRQLVQQEILSEQTRLSFGEKPPTVAIKLPETIKVGQKFNYEAIVEEPVEKDILLGQLIDQPVTTNSIVRPKTLEIDMPTILEIIGNRSFPRPRRRPKPNNRKIKLKRLRAGGFFKSGFAARTPENRWISAVLVRHNAGMTIVTKRLRVVEK